MKQKICIVIPIYNESKHILAVVKDIKKYTNANILFVDDGSKDNSSSILKNIKTKNVYYLLLTNNHGKGFALRFGCDFAIQTFKSDTIICMDGDLQHRGKDIPRLLEALKNKNIVFGYRKFNHDMPFVKRFGNRLISFLTYILYDIKLRDTQSGLKAFKTNIYPRIRWVSERYSLESEIIAKVSKEKLRYKEIPINTIYLEPNKGTKISDGFKIIKNLLRWKICKNLGNII